MSITHDERPRQRRTEMIFSGARGPALVVTCAAVLVFVAVRPMIEVGAAYADVFAPAEATAAGAMLGAAVAIVPIVGGMSRRALRRLIGPCVVAIALLLWTSGGLMFDLLRTAAVLGLPGLPPEVDWPGLAVRAAAMAATVQLVLFLAAVVRRSYAGTSWYRPSTRERLVLGVVTALLTTPYPLLKIHWWAGGGIAAAARGTTPHLGFPVGETLVFALAAATALALTTKAGRRFPRALMRIGGWVAATALITTGSLAVFGSAAQALGWGAAGTSYDGAWIVGVVYGSWLLLGLGVAACTVTYPKARRCGGSSLRRGVGTFRRSVDARP